MTIHEAVFSTLRQPVLGVLYLLFAAQMALVLAAFADKRSLKVRLLLLLHLLLTFFCFWMPLLDIDSNHYRTDVEFPLPEARSAFTMLPLWAMILYEIFTAAILLLAVWERKRYRDEHPTPDSIKETMDLLPAGIAFGREDGVAVFTNVTVNRLSRAFRGTYMDNLTDFEKACFPDTADFTDAIVHLPLPDGSAVWQFDVKTLYLGDESYVNMIATDITDEAAVTRKLEEQNRKLRDIQVRLKLYNQHVERIVLAQEFLNARMTIHNELGSVLLTSRRYLNDPASVDERALAETLLSTNANLMKAFERERTVRDALADSLETAESIGVNVELSGVPPKNEPQRGILAAAITECATNAVKHADGDALTVSMRDSGDALLYTLRSNGRPPQGEVRASGGLDSLRTLIEYAGGTMQIDSAPGEGASLEVKVTLPKGEILFDFPCPSCRSRGLSSTEELHKNTQNGSPEP